MITDGYENYYITIRCWMGFYVFFSQSSVAQITLLIGDQEFRETDRLRHYIRNDSTSFDLRKYAALGDKAHLRIHHRFI